MYQRGGWRDDPAPPVVPSKAADVELLELRALNRELTRRLEAARADANAEQQRRRASEAHATELADALANAQRQLDHRARDGAAGEAAARQRSLSPPSAGLAAHIHARLAGTALSPEDAGRVAQSVALRAALAAHASYHGL